MDVFRTENNCLKFHYDAEELWIQPWGANSFRIRATKLAEMPKENWALEMPVEDIFPSGQTYRQEELSTQEPRIWKNKSRDFFLWKIDYLQFKR